MANKRITEMTNKEAQKFLLKSSSYSTLKLPKYFDFEPLLTKIHKENYRKAKLNDFFNANDNSKLYNDINYVIMVNKSGKLSWRKLILTNPIAYVSIVQQICKKDNWDFIVKRFKEYSNNKNIKCCSLPVEATNIGTDKKEQILNWWNEFEQLTIKESINYKYMIITDISNCYPSIYTHTIPWALHGEKNIKQRMKDNKKANLLGDELDKSIQAISYAQTNGIPQGSILYDFIAEMILGYCDKLLAKKLTELQIFEYKILRYRDDYRIFSNNPSQIERILKELTIILEHHNLQINTKKTSKTGDILSNALKEDKIYGLLNPLDKTLNPQKKIYVIREIGSKYKNSGLLVKMLHEYYKNDIFPIKKQLINPEEITSIIVDIMDNNPRVYPECIAILSKIFSFYNDANKLKKVQLIRKRICNNMNVEYLDIWLQRLTISFSKNISYSTVLCQKIYNKNQIWNSAWAKCSYDEDMIINSDIINNIEEVIPIEEINDFLSDSYI